MLTACNSSNSDSGANDEIAGADLGATKASATPSPSVTDSARRPKVTLPSDVTNSFESWNTSDATENAVLADTSRRINALDYAITQNNTEESILSFYYKEEALVSASQWVKEFVDAKKSMTGETRFFKPTADVYDKGRATLTYCSFEGKAYVKDVETGEIERTPVSAKSYILYVTRLEQSDTGVWQTATLSSERGNHRCTS
ncbi:hypothetical protein FNH09_05150 [Streptomyces adustus]|uniref:Uncharacterized protein n=1 Tax=Streptomyces adustus TaxID=1609272 RepID=A0A5N8V7Y9_9ACTN|nr:hypothetical protein [Streptomyces adustus]